jgi:hypothetical protein
MEGQDPRRPIPRKGAKVINISEEQLVQVEYLIRQSLQGNHVLFNAHDVREAFLAAQECERFTDEDAYAVEHHIERLIGQPTLAEKRAYLEKLDPRTFKKVVRTYFNIVENNLFENSTERH